MAIRWLLTLVLVLALAAPASAAKWKGGCPKTKQRLSKVGKGPLGSPRALSRYFEHVGHTVTFYLKDTDVEHHGGFSTAPGGNTLEVTFTPIDGVPIALPPVAITAVTPSALTFTVPDTRPILGRLLAGPAKFAVKRDGVLMFEAFRQLILPPMNNVHALLQQGTSVEVLAAMDKAGQVWIPLDFSEFGQNGESLPACPTPLTPVTPFAVEFNLKKGDDQALPYVSFGQIKKNRLFLGDYVVFGLNMYGNKLSSALDMTPSGGNEIVLCGLNDALQLVVRLELNNPAIKDNSELLELTRDGSPVVVKIENVSLDPEVAENLENATYDSSHLPCYPAEPEP